MMPCEMQFLIKQTQLGSFQKESQGRLSLTHNGGQEMSTFHTGGAARLLSTLPLPHPSAHQTCNKLATAQEPLSRK